jgi:starch-binding outer membrane protein, SusD/RagB family
VVSCGDEDKKFSAIKRYGDKASFSRTFINTYLKVDGTPFTSTPAWETMLFKDEVKNRDLRLAQTIRAGD